MKHLCANTEPLFSRSICMTVITGSVNVNHRKSFSSSQEASITSAREKKGTPKTRLSIKERKISIRIRATHYLTSIVQSQQHTHTNKLLHKLGVYPNTHWNAYCIASHHLIAQTLRPNNHALKHCYTHTHTLYKHFKLCSANWTPSLFKLGAETINISGSNTSTWTQPEEEEEGGGEEKHMFLQALWRPSLFKMAINQKRDSSPVFKQHFTSEKNLPAEKQTPGFTEQRPDSAPWNLHREEKTLINKFGLNCSNWTAEQVNDEMLKWSLCHEQSHRTSSESAVF